MAVGDGTTWDETTPTDATYAVSIDDYNRELRKGVRGRMALEHEWPASQSATSEGGRHKYITLQQQAAAPTLSGTQVASIYVDTNDVLRIETAGGGNTLRPIVQMTNTQDGAVATGTTVMPRDDTIPQITEGDEYISLVVTPISATNNLKIDVVFNGAVGDGIHLSSALFVGTTADALACVANKMGDSDDAVNLAYTHYMAAGTAAARTFRVRAGGNSAGTLTFNGQGSARFFGGVMASSITITEIGV